MEIRKIPDGNHLTNKSLHLPARRQRLCGKTCLENELRKLHPIRFGAPFKRTTYVSGRDNRPHYRTDGSSRDAIHSDSEFLKTLAYSKMGDAASAPAAKRQSDPDIVFHFDPPTPFHVGIKHGCRAATKVTPIFSDS